MVHHQPVELAQTGLLRAVVGRPIMPNPIQSGLAAVRRRQQLALVIRALTLGFLASSLVGCVAAWLSWSAGNPLSVWLLLGLLAAGPVLGAVVAMVWSASW